MWFPIFFSTLHGEMVQFDQHFSVGLTPPPSFLLVFSLNRNSGFDDPICVEIFHVAVELAGKKKHHHLCEFFQEKHLSLRILTPQKWLF